MVFAGIERIIRQRFRLSRTYSCQNWNLAAGVYQDLTWSLLPWFSVRLDGQS